MTNTIINIPQPFKLGVRGEEPGSGSMGASCRRGTEKVMEQPRPRALFGSGPHFHTHTLWGGAVPTALLLQWWAEEKAGAHRALDTNIKTFLFLGPISQRCPGVAVHPKPYTSKPQTPSRKNTEKKKKPKQEVSQCLLRSRNTVNTFQSAGA